MGERTIDLAAGAAEPFSLRQVRLWRNPFTDRERGGYAAPMVTGSIGTSGERLGTFILTVRLRFRFRQSHPNEPAACHRHPHRSPDHLRGRLRVIDIARASRPRPPRLHPPRPLRLCPLRLRPRHRRSGRIRVPLDPRSPSAIRLFATSPNRSRLLRGPQARKSSSPPGGSAWARSSSTCSSPWDRRSSC